MTRPYIVLTGGDGGFGNLGDELLLRAVKELYRPYLDRYTVLVVKLNPTGSVADGYTYVSEDVGALEAAGFDPSAASLVHYYGGGYLNDHWYETKIALYRDMIAAGLDARKVAFTGQGLGPLSAEQTSELGRIAGASLMFGARDRAGMLGRSARLTFDDTVSLCAFTDRVRSPVPDGPVALSLRTEHYVGLEDEEVVSTVTVLDRYLRASGVDALAFGMVENPSYDETVTIAGALRRAGTQAIVAGPRPTTLAELVAYLVRCRVVVTTSYHVALVALYVGTPVIAVYSSEYYRLKFEGLADLLSTPLLRVMRVDAFDGDVIEHVVRAGADKRFRADLDVTLTELAHLNAEAHEEIRAML